MKPIINGLLFVIVTACAYAQGASIRLHVVHRFSFADEVAEGSVQAVFPEDQQPKATETQKIIIHPHPREVAIGKGKSLLVWFSYTNPPTNKHEVYGEADQPDFGAVLSNRTLYVCSWRSPELSVPVLNQYLRSVLSGRMSQKDARSTAVLLARCSEHLQVLDETTPELDGLREQLVKIGHLPTVVATTDGFLVTFFTWTGLPQGELSKWSIHMKGRLIADVKREHVTNI
ncbi:MAG: hypothetical protein LAO21_22015 [Acidobacteriia bacterium]|nr:hypothetical protein [Terriglobia bacterium]